MIIITCPVADTLQANITTIDSIAANKNFAFNCPNGFDVGVQSIYANTDFNPTHNTTLNIAAGNLFKRFGVSGCSDAVFNVAVKITGKSHYQTNAGLIAPTFISANNDSLYWANVAMGADLYNSFIINCKTDSTANAGDMVCFNINVTPTSGDMDSLNNKASQCFVVTTSHDPNYKEASPIGTAAFKQDWLTYTIHFQNTGTATAHNINVLDTLDSNLEPGTITLLNSSHPTIMQTVGNVARFIFANINLPDSNQSIPNSKGFVQFKIKHLPNLPLGTVIKNTADIYFDYNSAVVTNTTRTKNCNNSFAVINATICSGHAYVFNNHNLIVAGTYQDTLPNYMGCDSIITLHLSVGQTSFHSLSKFICKNEHYMFNNQSIGVSGIYTDTLQNYHGCDSIITLSLLVAHPDTSITQIGDTLFSNTTVGYNFNWFDCDSNKIVAGADSFKFTPSISGNYAVILTWKVNSSCIDTSQCRWLNISTGIEKVTTNNFLNLFPNPTNHSTVISLQHAVNNATIQLINLLGETVLTKTNQSGNQFSIDLSAQPSGIYFIEVQQQGNVWRGKVVKE